MSIVKFTFDNYSSDWQTHISNLLEPTSHNLEAPQQVWTTSLALLSLLYECGEYRFFAMYILCEVEILITFNIYCTLDFSNCLLTFCLL